MASQTNVSGTNAGPNSSLLPDQVVLSPGNIWKAAIFQLTLSPVQVNTVTDAEQNFATTGIGLLTTDIVFVSCAAPTAGIGITNARVSAADQLTIQFVNPTAGNLTQTASTVFNVLVLRPLPSWTKPASGNQFDW